MDVLEINDDDDDDTGPPTWILLFSKIRKYAIRTVISPMLEKLTQQNEELY